MLCCGAGPASIPQRRKCTPVACKVPEHPTTSNLLLQISTPSLDLNLKSCLHNLLYTLLKCIDNQQEMKFDGREMTCVTSEIDCNSAAMTKNLTEMKSCWTEMDRVGKEIDFVGTEINCDSAAMTKNLTEMKLNATEIDFACVEIDIVGAEIGRVGLEIDIISKEIHVAFKETYSNI